MAKRTGLGKGLGAIFGDEVMESAAEEQQVIRNHKEADHTAASFNKEKADSETGKEMFIKISMVEPNHNQPRKEFREEALIELAESMKEYGVLQPLLVQKKGDCLDRKRSKRRFKPDRRSQGLFYLDAGVWFKAGRNRSQGS
jgi:ParB family chromosome partitioning protein